MKNGLLVWNILLTLLLGYLFIAHLRGGKRDSIQGKSSSVDSLTYNKDFRIAYFEMDSVEANYQMVKDVKAEMSKEENKINNELDRLSQKYQQRYEYYQQQERAGRMTQSQLESASMELKALDNQIRTTKQNLDQDYNNFVVLRMKDVKKNIEDFIREYNKDKHYSYIVSYEQGLFYYKDSAYNITTDVIKGLNAAYKPKKN